MRNANIQSKSFFSIALVALFLTSGFGYASQTKKDSDKLTFTKKALLSLQEGIKSDNPGLQRSSIYFAGKYKIEETKEILMKTLENESDANTRILIALALFEMGDDKAMETIGRMAVNEDNDKVKRMFSAIYLEHKFSEVKNISINEFASTLE